MGHIPDDSKTTTTTTPPVQTIPMPVEHFSHVHVDLVGPFVSNQGQHYIMTMIDRTTCWPEAVPIADATADTVLQAFLAAWIARFGFPHTVTSDRGVQFTSAVWQSALSRLGIRIAATTSYYPQSNRMVERFHRTLKDALRCSVRASRSWVRSLPWVLLGICNAPKLDTSTYTAEVVFGVPLRVPGACFQGDRATATEQLQLSRTNASSFTSDMLDSTRFKASPFVAKSLRLAKYVYVRDDRLGKQSLAPKYLGPFKVLSKDWSKNIFHLEMGKKENSVSLARLKVASIPEEAM